MRPILAVCFVLAAACADSAAPGPTSTIHTVLFYREDTGRNFLLNSDGTAERVVAIGDSGLVPLGMATNGGEVAFLANTALVIANLNDPGQRDTVLHPVPAQISPVAFSPDGRRIALFQYGPEPRLLVIDRNGGIDSVVVGPNTPDLPPAFSPDGTQIALISVTQLSVILSVVNLEPRQIDDEIAGFSRFIYQPVFGWPRWTEDGVLMATVRAGDEVDTLAIMAITPNGASRSAEILYRVVSPVLLYDAGSSYALSPDGRALVVAAFTTLTGRRRLYYASGGGRLTNLLDDPTARPAFPLVLP